MSIYDYKQLNDFLKALDPSANQFEFRHLHDREKDHPDNKSFRLRVPINRIPPRWHKDRDFGYFVTINKGGRKASEISHVRAFFIDLDGRPLPDSITPAPTAIVKRDDTHFHVYWMLDTPAAMNAATFERVQKELIRRFDSDGTVFDLPRIMRLPGSLHYKDPDDIKKIELIHCDPETRYRKEVFTGGRESADRNRKQKSLNTAELYANVKPRIKTFQDRLNTYPVVKDGQGRESTFYKLACYGRDLGITPEDRLPLLLSFNKQKIDPPVSEDVVISRNLRAEEYAKGEPGSATAEADFEDAPLPPAGDELKPVPVEGLQEALDGWVYVLSIKALRHIDTGVEVPSSEINMVFGRHVPPDAKKTVHHYVSRFVQRCETLVYEPESPPLVPGKLPGWSNLNIYRPTTLEPVQGCMRWFEGLTETLFPDAKERMYVIDWMTHVVQSPSSPAKFALLIHSAKKGIGKSYLGHLLARIVGRDVDDLSAANARMVTNDDLSGTSTRWVEGKRLIIAEEVMQPGRIDLVNRLKIYISEPVVSVKRLYTDPFALRNYANYYLLTNHEDALRIEDDERRFLILSCPSVPQSSEYWRDMWENETEYASRLYYFLLNRKIELLDPYGHAPKTRAGDVMRELNRTDIESLIQDRLENGQWPFNSGLFKPELFIRHPLFAPFAGHKGTLAAIRKTLRHAGANSIGMQIRHRDDGTSCTRSRPWALKPEEWQGRSAQEVQDAYELFLRGVPHVGAKGATDFRDPPPAGEDVPAPE